MDIVIPLYDRFTALDAIGPYEVLSRLPDTTVHFVGMDGTGPKTTETGMLTVQTESGIEDFPHPEVFVIPGGLGTRTLMKEDRVLDWVRGAHESSTWTASVCTGSLLLAAAGILDGIPAACHWLALDLLGELGAEPTGERVVRQGKIITAAGVSSGIDMALGLAAELHGELWAQGIQLGIEYDPQPPFDAGSPDKAPADLVELVRANASVLA